VPAAVSLLAAIIPQICEVGSPSPGSQQRLLADLSPPGRGEDAERVARTNFYFVIAGHKALPDALLRTAMPGGDE